MSSSARTIRSKLPTRKVGWAKSQCPPYGTWSVQREHVQVARVHQVVVLDRMQVSAAGLHREILLGSDRVGHRRALEWRAEIETPQLLERLVLIGDDPAVLRSGKDDPARRDQRAGADLDIRNRL